MATLRINTPDEIEFQNFRADVSRTEVPYVIAQVGEWEMGAGVEAGIVVNAVGTEKYSPILSALDARKLAKWLNKAADALDGSTENHKKKPKRAYYEQDDESNYKF